jgi:hypothetical protein
MGKIAELFKSVYGRSNWLLPFLDIAVFGFFFRDLYILLTVGTLSSPIHTVAFSILAVAVFFIVRRFWTTYKRQVA